MTMTLKFFNMMSSSIFFWFCFVFLVKFSYWSTFNVNIITGSGVMTIFLYLWFTGTLEIGNPSFWVFSNICQVRNIKFDTNVSNKMLLNAAKCQSYSFYRFWVTKGKPTGQVKVHPPPSPTHEQWGSWTK